MASDETPGSTRWRLQQRLEGLQVELQRLLRKVSQGDQQAYTSAWHIHNQIQVVEEHIRIIERKPLNGDQ